MKSGAGLVSWTTSLLPFARTPEIVVALPSTTSCAPLTMSEERDAGRLHLRVREPVERVDEALRVHGLAVRELEAGLDRERVGLSVLRDDRETGSNLRGRNCAGGAFLVGPVEELAGGDRLELPRLAVVAELGIDVVDVRASSRRRSSRPPSAQRMPRRPPAWLGPRSRGSRSRKAVYYATRLLSLNRWCCCGGVGMGKEISSECSSDRRRREGRRRGG